jgi:hypothetical protein
VLQKSKEHWAFREIKVVKKQDLCCLVESNYTRKNLASCSKSANKPSTSCVRTACPKLLTSMEQAVNNL